MKDHLNEIKRVTEIFVQFEIIIKDELKARIQKFLDLIEDTYDEIDNFRSLILEVHLYRCLVGQLPEKVAFPMFEVGLL